MTAPDARKVIAAELDTWGVAIRPDYCADEIIAALSRAGYRIEADEPTEDDADLPTAADVRGILGPVAAPASVLSEQELDWVERCLFRRSSEIWDQVPRLIASHRALAASTPEPSK